MDWPKLLLLLHEDDFLFTRHDEAQSLASQHFDGLEIVRKSESLSQSVLLHRRFGLRSLEAEKPVATTPYLQLAPDEHDQNKACDGHDDDG